jgi:hypothetical protein
MRILRLFFFILIAGLLAAAAPEQSLSPRQVSGLINAERRGVPDSVGWAIDLLDVLRQHDLDASRENICAAIAVISQESSFVADPSVPGLGKLSEKTLRDKADRIPVVGRLALNFLENNPTPQDSYMERIRNARTERDLDLTWRALVADAGKHASLTLVVQSGLFNTFIEDKNEIDTIGSMQVSVKFAIDEHRRRRWTPMMLEDVYAVRDDLYTRHGGMYYGVLQLLGYETGYNKKIYRFADFNAGRYASRNAAFQSVIAALSGRKIDRDGDLLIYAGNGSALATPGQSEKALRAISQAMKLGLSDKDIRDDLLREKKMGFASTRTFLTLREAYARKTGKAPAFAEVPAIKLNGPKIRRGMTTADFANAVNRRYQACMGRKI